MTMRCRNLAWPAPGLLLVLALWLGAQTPSEQILYYLCAWFPAFSNGTTPATLYRVAAQGGAPQLVRAVGKGVDTVLADYDRRKLVVASPGDTPHTFAVIDMDSPEKEHSASIDYDHDPGVVPESIYLLDIPQRGLWVALSPGSPSKTPPVWATALAAVSLEAENAKAESLPFSALADIRFSGFVGGVLAQRHPEWVRGDPLHTFPLGDPAGCSLDIPRPPYVTPAADRPASYNLMAVNDSLVLLTPDTPRPAARDVVDIYDRSTHTWHRATLPFTVSAVRAFGPWVTAISTRPRGGPAYGAGRTTFNSAEFAAMPPSPGREKRLAEKFGRTTVDEPFNESSDYFPGDLLVLNGRTDQRYMIHTGEGDSEVILATNDSVYYRVNDAIFRADIAPGKLAAGVKIAEGPDVPQAHWAFLGRATK